MVNDYKVLQFGFSENKGFFLVMDKATAQDESFSKRSQESCFPAKLF